MTNKPDKSLPKRKEPGLLAGMFSFFFGVLFWLFFSLVLSIVIEWIGIAFFWSEEGAHHSRDMLTAEIQYVNHHLVNTGSTVNSSIYTVTAKIIHWLEANSGLNQFIQWLALPSHESSGKVTEWRGELYSSYQAYILAVPVITQLFFVRLTIVIFSLPAFVLFGVVGIVDGLVERDLRRWGGGRESSNVYNLARKAVFPTFIAACVVYLSSPVTVHPAWVVVPFAVLFGLALRISFSRLKKYF